MKKTILTMLLATLASLFALTSCQKNEEPADLIVGTWTLTSMNISANGVSMDIDPAQMGVEYEFIFKSDGSMQMNIYEGEDGETLYANYDILSNSEKMVLNIYSEGETTTTNVLQLDSSTLVLNFSEQEAEEAAMDITLTFTKGRVHPLN